jgi:hypothetical protein
MMLCVSPLAPRRERNGRRHGGGGMKEGVGGDMKEGVGGGV